MREYLNQKSAGSTVYLACLLLLAAIWFGTDSIRESMEAEEIYQLSSVKSGVSAVDVKGLRSVSEKSPIALKQERALAQAEGVGADVDVDAVFGDKHSDEAPPPPPPAFEFDKFFKQNAVLNAVSSNGAVINGHFFETGGDMEVLALVGDQGKKVVPVLRSVNETVAVVSVEKKLVSLHLRGTM